ncbi:MAG TPA: hypothetical protein VFY44_05750 [Thermoleophilaceae bacterium]|nr:hypothetical protein [Thermoleophilaceae bacterium]
MPDEVEFGPPLPGDAQHATVRIDGDKARIEVRGLDGKTDKRKVTATEARAWIADVERRHREAAEWSARARERTDERRGEREALLTSLDLGCGRCGGTLAKGSRVKLLAGDRPEQALRDEDFAAGRRSIVAYDEYACERCGAVQLFKPGFLAG